MVSRHVMLVLCVTSLTSLVSAQNRIGPVYPSNRGETRSVEAGARSGYDPFVFNWASGRWNYVPIPYDTRSGPFAFNWHSGRWDYAPQSFNPADNSSVRLPERMRGDDGQTTFAGGSQNQFVAGNQAAQASATIQPSPQINRSLPAVSRRAFNYTTSDPDFDSWYGSTSTAK